MSRYPLSRRQFLTLPLGLVLAPLAGAAAETEQRRAAYDADIGLLYNALSFELVGTVEEAVDRVAGRYQFAAVGQGARISNRIESRGIRRDGRWAPLQASAWFQVAGRESRSEVAYDWDRRVIDYHFRGETFLLRRLRVADDRVSVPEGQDVDDVISAVLNYADGLWRPEPDGSFRTHVIRRRRPDDEAPDAVQQYYRAEIVSFVLRVAPDPETGKPTALFDLSRFSSWAKAGRPARIVFGPNRRPEAITAPMILGTSVTIRLKEPG
jgi:hypothetical protein